MIIHEFFENTKELKKFDYYKMGSTTVGIQKLDSRSVRLFYPQNFKCGPENKSSHALDHIFRSVKVDTVDMIKLINKRLKQYKEIKEFHDTLWDKFQYSFPLSERNKFEYLGWNAHIGIDGIKIQSRMEGCLEDTYLPVEFTLNIESRKTTFSCDIIMADPLSKLHNLRSHGSILISHVGKNFSNLRQHVIHTWNSSLDRRQDIYNKLICDLQRTSDAFEGAFIENE